jgi:hypothetical protein
LQYQFQEIVCQSKAWQQTKTCNNTRMFENMATSNLYRQGTIALRK